VPVSLRDAACCRTGSSGVATRVDGALPLAQSLIMLPEEQNCGGHLEDLCMATERPGTKAVETPANAASNGAPEEDLSRAALLELFGEDENLLRELVGLFLEDSPPLLNDLRAGVAGLDAAMVERAAHALKGSVGNFGAKRLAELARQLETMGRARDLAGAREALTALEQELERVSAQLVGVAAEKSR